MICYICFCLLFLRIFDMYLLFTLWKSVEHNQSFFCLEISCFFSITLILSTLLNFFTLVLSGWIIKKAILTVDLHCIKTIVVAMTFDDMGYVAEAKSFFHRICKNI